MFHLKHQDWEPRVFQVLSCSRMYGSYWLLLHRLISTQCVWTVESLHHYLKIVPPLLFPKKSHQSPVWSPVGNDRQCWGKEHVKQNHWEAGKSQEWLHVTQPCLFTDTVDEESTSKTAEIRGGIRNVSPSWGVWTSLKLLLFKLWEQSRAFIIQLGKYANWIIDGIKE